MSDGKDAVEDLPMARARTGASTSGRIGRQGGPTGSARAAGRWRSGSPVAVLADPDPPPEVERNAAFWAAVELDPWRRRRQDGAALNSWRYRIVWRPVPEPAGSALAGRWSVVVPTPLIDDPLVRWCLDGLARHGAQVVPVAVDPLDVPSGALRGRLRDLLGGPAGPDGSPVGVLSLLAMDVREHPAHPEMTAGLAAGLALLQALHDIGGQCRLWLATTGAVSTGPHDPVHSPEQHATWGMARCLALEEPERWGGLVDLPAEPGQGAQALLATVLAGLGDEDQVAVRAEGLRVRRLVRAPLGRATTPAWRTSGTALVTGGTGGIGGHVARWLVGRGAEHLVLVSRSGSAAAAAADLVAELSASGASVTVEACDVTDAAALAEVVARARAQGPPIRSVWHTAGVVRVVPLATTGLEEFAAGGRAKAAGAATLDGLFAHEGLDAFVVFTSVAGLWGSGHHGAYAASNAFADALVQRRRARGLVGTAVPWGIWRPVDDGMAVEIVREQMRWRGLPFMSPRLAVAGLQQVLEQDEAHLAVADIDWERFLPVFTAARSRPLLREIPQVASLTAACEPDGAGGPVGASTAGWAELLRALRGPQRERVLVEAVRGHVAAALGYDGAAAVEVNRSFRELGFDSLTAVDLRNRLAAVTGLGLPVSVIFDRPTVTALARHLLRELFPAAPTTAEP